MKAYRLEQAERRGTEGEVSEGFRCKASIIFRDVLSSPYQNRKYSKSVAIQASSLKLWCPEFLLVLLYIGMLDLIIGHMTELNLQSSSLPWR